MAESIFEVYNLACTYFELCNLHTKEVMVPVFLDKPGVAGWDTRLGDTEGGWRSVLPPAAEALQCFYPKPALWIADPMLHDKVSSHHSGCKYVSMAACSSSYNMPLASLVRYIGVKRRNPTPCVAFRPLLVAAHGSSIDSAAA